MKYFIFLSLLIPLNVVCQEPVMVSSTLCGENVFVLEPLLDLSLDFVDFQDSTSTGDTTVTVSTSQTITTEKRIFIDTFCQGKGELTVEGRPFTGLVTDTYSNGQVKYLAPYKNGSPTGKQFTYYMEDGTELCSIKLKSNKAKSTCWIH